MTKRTSGIKWAQPEPLGSRPRKLRHDAFFAELRKNPGVWAVFSESVASSATAVHIRSGRMTGGPAGEFEATARKNEDGTYTIYAQHVGPS